MEEGRKEKEKTFLKLELILKLLYTYSPSQLQKTPMALKMYDLHHYRTSKMKNQKPLFWYQLMFLSAQRHNGMLT